MVSTKRSPTTASLTAFCFAWALAGAGCGSAPPPAGETNRTATRDSQEDRSSHNREDDDTGGPVDANINGPDAPCVDCSDPQCVKSKPQILFSCVDQGRYEEDLRFIAQERVPGSPHWQLVQDRCADVLQQLGFEVERQSADSGLVNVVGTLEGRSRADESVLVMAHYDHIQGCPGADDNASGTAGILELARLLSPLQPSRSLVVACVDREESGLVGSRALASRANRERHKIAIAVNFDMIAYGADPEGQGPVYLDSNPQTEFFAAALERYS